MESHSIIRVLGIISTVFTLYKQFTSPMPLDDLTAILAISLAVIWLGDDLKKRKTRHEEEVPEEKPNQQLLEIEKLLGIGRTAPVK